MEGLSVTGVHAMLFDDDASAAFVESREALLPWSQDGEILIDRFDVRHLLLDSTLLRSSCSASAPLESEEELDFERYRDLLQDKSSGSDVEREMDDQPASTSSYRSVPFDYERASGEQHKATTRPVEEMTPFTPTFPVPEHLQAHLPPSQKIHQIISGTAKFVSERGGQAEIVLRVKQADNPVFGFLTPDHVLHPYFRYLVDHPELAAAPPRVETSAGDPPALHPVGTSVVKPGDSLRLLGEAYGDEDDEEEPRTGEKKALPLTVEVKTIKEPPPTVKLVIDKMVEFICRNGKNFEDVVKERDESADRFQFLHPWHEYHPYYLSKLSYLEEALSFEQKHVKKQAKFTGPSVRGNRFDVIPDILQQSTNSEDASSLPADNKPGMLEPDRTIEKQDEKQSVRNVLKRELSPVHPAAEIKAERLKRARLLMEREKEKVEEPVRATKTVETARVECHGTKREHNRSETEGRTRKSRDSRRLEDRDRERNRDQNVSSRHRDRDRRSRRRSLDEKEADATDIEISEDIRAKVRDILKM